MAATPRFTQFLEYLTFDDVLLQPGAVLQAKVLSVGDNNQVRIAIGGQTVEATTQVPLQAGQTLPKMVKGPLTVTDLINFHMGAGWLIYDLNVMGIWLIENYRTQFTKEINAGGIDGLISSLAERNKSNARK